MDCQEEFKKTILFKEEFMEVFKDIVIIIMVIIFLSILIINQIYLF